MISEMSHGIFAKDGPFGGGEDRESCKCTQRNFSICSQQSTVSEETLARDASCFSTYSSTRCTITIVSF